MISLILSGLYGLEADRNYTEMEFHRSLGIEAVYSTSDVLRLMSYDKDHRGNFYDYALQGSFLHAAHRQKTKLPRKLSQCRTIQELYESKTSKQEFRETLAGVRKLLSEKHNESSPCVIAFCLLSEIMPHKKRAQFLRHRVFSRYLPENRQQNHSTRALHSDPERRQCNQTQGDHP